MTSISPYGMTIGINQGTYPITDRLNNNVVIWAWNAGLRNFRFQIDAQWIWRNQADDWTLWDWAPLDDAISKIKAQGFKVIYPLRGWPTWGLQTTAYQATDEPHFMPDPTVVRTYALGVAARYNGVYNIPTYGPMFMDGIEIGNEEYNINFTKSTLVYVLNQAVTAGNSYTTLAINAISPTFPTVGTAGVPIAIGTHLQFGGSGGSGEKILVSQATNNGDTLLHITNLSGGAFVPAQSYLNGSNITIVYYGLRTSPYAEYNGINGILNSANPTPQPARDPWFMQQALNIVAPALRGSGWGGQIGMGAIWWMRNDNYYDFIVGLGSALGNVDYLNCHFYTGGNDPLNPTTTNMPSITAAIGYLHNAASASGYPNLPIRITEFGWQVPDDVTESVQASQYVAVLDACRNSGLVEQVDLFTISASQTGSMPHSSIVQWQAATATYKFMQAYTQVQSYTALYPSWVNSSAANAWYVNASGGNDSNSGLTSSAPFATLGKAATVVGPGDTVYISPGTYTLTSGLILSTSGTSINPITFVSTNPLGVLIRSGGSIGTLVTISGTYNIFQGFDVGVGDSSTTNGIVITGANSFASRCLVHDLAVATGPGAGISIGSAATSASVNGCKVYNIGNNYGSRTDQTVIGITSAAPSASIKNCLVFNSVGWNISSNGASNSNLIENNDTWGAKYGEIQVTSPGGTGSVTPLTIYANQDIASNTTSAKMVTNTAGTSNSGVSSLVGQATGWGEVTSLGTSAAWAALSSIGAPTGNGWLFDSNVLDNQTLLGNWLPLLRMNVSASSLTVNMVSRAYKIAIDGTYILIGTIGTLNTQSIGTTSANYIFTNVSLGRMDFEPGSMLYIDVWLQITTPAVGTGVTVRMQTCNQIGLGRPTTSMNVTTPGYKPTSFYYVNDNTVVANNIISNSTASSGFAIAETGGNVTTGIHNLYTNNIIFGGTATTISLQNSLVDTGTIRLDPQFVRFVADGSGDYHLQPGSPAIDTANATYAPSTDFDGVARPQLTGFDIGAYEAFVNGIANGYKSPVTYANAGPVNVNGVTLGTEASLSAGETTSVGRFISVGNTFLLVFPSPTGDTLAALVNGSTVNITFPLPDNPYVTCTATVQSSLVNNVFLVYLTNTTPIIVGDARVITPFF